MKILSSFIVFVGYMLIATSGWIPRKFGPVTYEQIVFHMEIPLSTETRLIYSYLQNTVLIALLLVIALAIIMHKTSPRKCLLYSFIFLIFSVILSWHRLDANRLIDEYHHRMVMGNFYEKHYVDSHNVKIKAPEKKRNLIMIFVESMETTYANSTYFGDNLIPGLQKLAEENINFSHNNSFGGFVCVDGAAYTQASLVAQLCAVPFHLPIKPERYHPKGSFMSGTLCLPDILAKEGYNQSFMNGLTRTYAGTDKFIETHGQAKILDWDFYSKRDSLSKNTDPNRKNIVRDAQLYEYAKEELLELQKQDKPFFLTLMTLDTHFGIEHFPQKNCQIKYHDPEIPDEEYFKNVVSCADKQVIDFIDWLSKQSFYENTEIVIVGDHLTMSSTIFKKDMERRVYNTYINSTITAQEHVKNRQFTALDTMPTILEGMGYTIDGHKIGLGVSLFSGEKTLIEQMSVENFEKEARQRSHIYNRLLKGKLAEK